MIELLDQKVYVTNELNTAKFSLTAPQLDLLCVIAWKVNGNDYTQITVTYDELREMYGESKVYYKHLAPIFRGLRDAVIEVYEKDASMYRVRSLVNGYDFSKKQGFAVFYLDMFIVNLMQWIKGNSSIFQLRTILALRSVHSKRIYMQVSQFTKSGVYCVGVDDLKKRLGLVNAEGKFLYHKYSDFEKRVLNQAIKEVNDSSELKLTLQPGKQGKQREEITLLVERKDLEQWPLTEQQTQHKIILTRLKITPWQVNNILWTLDSLQVGQLINKIQTHISSGKVRDVPGYAVACFRDKGVSFDKRLNVPNNQVSLNAELESTPTREGDNGIVQRQYAPGGAGHIRGNSQSLGDLINTTFSARP